MDSRVSLEVKDPRSLTLRAFDRQLRIHKRRCSDGFMNVNLEALFNDQYKPIEEKLAKKNTLYKETPGVDVPILKDRLHYSFIWEA